MKVLSEWNSLACKGIMYIYYDDDDLVVFNWLLFVSAT